MKAVKITNKTKKQLQFLGSEFHKEGCGVLTVTDSYKKGDNTLFSTHCSVCSDDYELFPEEEMLISKNNLNQNKYPCRCSSGWKPSYYQYKILVLRFAKDKGDEILGFDEDFTVNVRTKGYGDWSISANNYLRGKRSPDETKFTRISKIRVPDVVFVDKFLRSGSFLEGTKFWRSDKRDFRGYYSYWNYYCPVCSNDQYVKEGLCDGIFTGVASTLSKGNRACRCSTHYKWSQKQREYQLNLLLNQEGSYFIEWEGDYGGSFGKFNWVCSKGHSCSTEVSNFIHLNHRCRVCAENFWGFYQERSTDIDTLYLIRLHKNEEVFYKIGRTFKAKDRFQYFGKFYNLDVVSLLQDTHLNTFRREKYFKSELLSLGLNYKPKIGFDGSLSECFNPEILKHPEIVTTFNLTQQPKEETHNVQTM